MLNILIDPSENRKLADFRMLGMTDVMVLGRYRYAQAHESLALHTHGEMFEICLMDEGEQPYVIEGRRYLLRGGDILLTLPNEWHGSGPVPLNRGRLYWLLIRVPRKNERFLNLPPVVGHKLIRALLNPPFRHFCGRRHLKGCLEKMFAVFAAPEAPFRVAELQNWALRFVLDVLHDAQEQSRHPIHDVMRNVQAYVEEHLTDEQLWLPDLAAAAGFSLSHFKSQFKREVGLSPGNYITLRRVERAKEFLSSTTQPVTEIGFALGFQSSQYFATVFKKSTGITPQDYRKLHLTNREHGSAPSQQPVSKSRPKSQLVQSTGSQ